MQSAKQISQLDSLGPLGEIRSASGAAGGLAVTTTLKYLALPDGATLGIIHGRNYSTAVVIQFALNPYLAVLLTQDNLATISDYSQEAQDGDAATQLVLDSVDTFANGDFLLVGSHRPFGGVDVDVDSANGTSSVLTVKYWDGSNWTDISDTDNTTSGGASLAQDGTVTWTVPSAWTKASLVDINSPAPNQKLDYRNEPLYWTRWEWSVQLDSEVEIDAMLPMAPSTLNAELVTGVDFKFRIEKKLGGVSAIEAKTNAGTANMTLNVVTSPGGAF